MGTAPQLTAMPQFEPISSSLPLQGFDREAFPRWQIIATGLFKTVFLDNAGLPGPVLAVRILNPGIADLTESPSIPVIPRREFRITGKISGPTFVQVFAPNGTTVIGQLQIVVKNETRLKIAIHRVTDGLIETTARPQATAANLLADLSSIFSSQANIDFDSPPSTASTLSLRTTLPELVIEQRENRRPPNRNWDELDAAGDSSSHLNVFFMKWHGTPGRLPSPIIENQTNIIFEDGMPQDNVLIALAHRIGLFFGCKVTASDRHKHHVMHASRADGVSGGPAGIHFIPRDASNIMNISGFAGLGT